MCGEKKNTPLFFLLFRGSPPRVRGKGRQIVVEEFVHGITPACAGKSLRPSPPAGRARDHPRVCGEKALPALVSLFTAGSPPRVRGKDLSLDMLRTLLGITPACAGKSLTNGEQERSQYGSPPRVRGKAQGDGQKPALCRITPACAGKRLCADISEARERDHPRVCGEKTVIEGWVMQQVGSPPRVRGKASMLALAKTGKRITPACAGKSGSEQRGV